MRSRLLMAPVLVLGLAACAGPVRSSGSAGSFPAPSSAATSTPSRPTASPSASTASGSAARQVVGDYYQALHDLDGEAAYELVCFQQQYLQTAAEFAREVQADADAGTGITSWTAGGEVSLTADTAVVPGTVVLDEGGSYEIRVGLVLEDDGYRVCATDLGGILPGPDAGSGDGTGSDASRTPGTT